MALRVYLALYSVCVFSAMMPGQTTRPASQPATAQATSGQLTNAMRDAYSRFHPIHSGMDRKIIEQTVDAIFAEIPKHEPTLFVPLMIDQLIRLGPRDPRTRALLHECMAKGWIEPYLTRYMLIQTGEDPQPHVQAMIEALDSGDAVVRQQAIIALGGCGGSAKPALPRLRRFVQEAQADPSIYHRAYTLGDKMPDHVRAYSAIENIEGSLRGQK